MINQAKLLLKKFYGYDDFRPGQAAIINCIINGQDTLAIMPTGAGKSICFQIPALLFPGITIVISPLISLMKDQVDALLNQGIPATYINSSLSAAQLSRRLYDIGDNRYKLIYVAPERLSLETFQQLLAKLTVSMVAVDEAHCLSQWGHDFRPSYQAIYPFICALPKRPLLSAFTATATPEVKRDIINLLGLYHPNVYVSGFDRPNLFFQVLRGENKQKFLLKYVKEHANQSGIIYAATRKEVDSIYTLLNNKGYNAGHYHAGLSDVERTQGQDDFLYDRVQVMVATNAFGMGIDKSNVRYVIHYNMPRNMEAYYQEAGRSGRDGEPGECILLFNSPDIMMQKFLIDKSIENPDRKQHELGKLQSMVDYCHTPNCLRKYIINYFGETDIADTCDNCANCNMESELVNITIDAQKVFSCIYRLNERFGITMIAEVLKGSKNKKLLQLGLDRLPTYGLFAKRTIDDIKVLIQRLIATQYLTLTESDYPVVKLLPIAYRVMKNEEIVWQKIAIIPKSIVEDQTADLFDNLRSLRRRLAEEQAIPPYQIFADSTLHDMCREMPQTITAMRHVKGIGEVKLAKYGEVFLNEILAYNSTLVSVPQNSHDHTQSSPKESKQPTHLITIDYFNQGFSITDIAKQRNLTPQTVQNHLFKAADEGITFDFDRLIPSGTETQIIAAIKKMGSTKLRPIKDILSPEIPYEAIRAVIYKYSL